jgi:hypothetical protein
MPRLNLTLDDGTYRRLGEHAKKTQAKRATLAKALLVESMDRREAAARARALAEAYAADRDDPEVRELLRDLEPGALEILGDEHA